MKKLLLAVITIVSLTLVSNKARAQYPIPSFNVPIVSDPTTFEEMQPAQSPFCLPFDTKALQVSPPLTREDKDLLIIVKRDNGGAATASFVIYAIGTTIEYGPYSVTGEDIFSITLSSTYEWGVEVISATESAKLSVWFE